MDSINGGKLPSILKGPLMMVGWKREEDRLSVPEDSVTFIDYPGMSRDMTIRVDPDKIQIERRDNSPTVTIRRPGNDIEVHVEGGREDTKILRMKDEMKIDRKSSEQDVTIYRQGNNATVDRQGVENDAKIYGTKASQNPLPFPVYITWDGEVIEQL